MFRFPVSLILVGALISGVSVLAQKPGKEWTEWSAKEATKMLDDSAWGKTQVETDTSEMVYSPTAITAAANATSQAQGATNQATSVKFHIWFFTARPIRQALVRQLEVQNRIVKANVETYHSWANLHTDEYIIIAVTYEGSDRRFLGRAQQAFESAVTAVLKDSTYLERKDGKRIFLSEYRPPKKDGFGAHFVFPRALGGEPFLNADSGTVRFHCEWENLTTLDSTLNSPGQTSRRARGGNNGSIQPDSAFKIKLDMRFKVADMIYDGALEY
jgi:hypothetical protein